MMNKWQKVLDIINEVQGTDIKMGEEFEIEGDIINPRLYLNMKITNFGLEDCYGNKHKNNALALLIYGDVKIKTKQFVPKVGEKYFIAGIEEVDLYCETYWEDCDCDKLWLKRGICFKTKEEAIASAKKMLEVANDRPSAN